MRKQQPETDEAASRVEFDSAELEREEDQTLTTSSLNAFDDGSESSTATLFSTKAFIEQLAFVEVLGHNVMMLHSDQEPVLVQLLKTVQSRRPIETSVRCGPRITHQSQSKIKNANQVSNTLENLLREDCQMTAFHWPGRFVTLRGHTAVPTDNLNPRWGHGIWIGEAPMTDECIILTESEIVAPRDTQGEVLDQ